MLRYIFYIWIRWKARQILQLTPITHEIMLHLVGDIESASPINAYFDKHADQLHENISKNDINGLLHIGWENIFIMFFFFASVSFSFLVVLNQQHEQPHRVVCVGVYLRLPNRNHSLLYQISFKNTFWICERVFEANVEIIHVCLVCFFSKNGWCKRKQTSVFYLNSILFVGFMNFLWKHYFFPK